MNVSELRVGNYVMHEPTIDDWSEIRIKVGTIIQCEISPDSFEPILLTEEWLKRCNFNFEKLGFKNLSASYGITSNEFHFHIGNYAKKINYVHQLQNLYFVLTGEELTIK